jgi:hypothetical protein
MANFWDDPDVKVSNDWFKFENVGDEVGGTIAKLGKRAWADGSVGIEIQFKEDDVPSLTASQVLLKAALFHLKPQPGDHITMAMSAVDKRPGGKTLKQFRVDLKRKDGESETYDTASGAAF